MNLRPYQTRAIADLRAVYAQGKRAPVLVLPTGAGKTVIAAEIIRSALSRSRKVLFLAHRSEILGQSVSKLSAAGVHDVRTIKAASDLGNPLAPVAVASVQTLTKWGDRMPAADLVIFDECHHTIAKTWARIADRYSNALLLGLTATPQRGDGKPLGDVFDSLVVGSTVAELVALGHLVPCRVFAPPNVLETAELALSPSAAYAQHGRGERAVIFCVTVEHASRVADEMTASGIPCEVLHGGSRNRADILSRFARGETRAVANVHVLTEGWDDPAVSVCILARKPEHVGTFLQMVGRVLRPAPDKREATLIDLCGSVLEHGTPEQDREYALSGKAISGADRQPLRQCPSCGAVFVAVPTCPQCGVTLPVRPVSLPTDTGVGVQEIGPVAPRTDWAVILSAKFQGRCTRCPGLIHVGDRIAWIKGKRPNHVDCNDPRGERALEKADALLRDMA